MHSSQHGGDVGKGGGDATDKRGVVGTTGDILWANTVSAGGDFEDAGLGAMVEQLFNGFPK